MTAYISEIDTRGGIGNEFVEVAVPVGTDMSGFTLYIYDEFGSVLSGPFGMGSVQSTIAGQDVYVLDNSTVGLPGIHSEEGVALVDDSGSLVQFISFDNNVVSATEGPASGQSSTEIGTSSSSGSLQSDDGGSTYYSQSTPNSGTVPCYAPGTRIKTPSGWRAVEDLRPGDRVNTADNGPQTIRWVRSQTYPLDAVSSDAKPVLIQAGALGRGCPAQDLVVSPQHRILVGGQGQLQLHFKAEVFVPAKSLTGLAGIRHMNGKASITWVHFACDQHEVVNANGCQSESLLLGPLVVHNIPAPERQNLLEMFGAPVSPEAALNGPPARICLTPNEVGQCLERAGQPQTHQTGQQQITPRDLILQWDAVTPDDSGIPRKTAA